MLRWIWSTRTPIGPTCHSHCSLWFRWHYGGSVHIWRFVFIDPSVISSMPPDSSRSASGTCVSELKNWIDGQYVTHVPNKTHGKIIYHILCRIYIYLRYMLLVTSTVNFSYYFMFCCKGSKFHNKTEYIFVPICFWGCKKMSSIPALYKQAVWGDTDAWCWYMVPCSYEKQRGIFNMH